jgi:hypothetical protein
MAHLAPNYEERQEFWKPVVAPHAESALAHAGADQVCQSCGTGYILGSRFCHICGADRHVNLADAADARVIRDWFNIAGIRDTLGQTTASLVAFSLGFVFLIAAAVTGFLFTATTLLDWQAVQIWRIEWLLAAAAVFIAGVLLKKK